MGPVPQGHRGPSATEWTMLGRRHVRDDDMEVDPTVANRWEMLTDNMMQGQAGREMAYQENVETMMANEQKHHTLVTLLRNMMSQTRLC